MPDGLGGPSLGGLEVRIMPVMRRAIRADDFLFTAHVEIDMGMIEGRLGADAHELVRAGFDRGDAHVILQMGNCARHDRSLKQLVTRAR